MKFLIIGATGLVGSALYKESKKRGHTILGTYNEHLKEGLEKLDYADTGEVSRLLSSFLPDVILCPAGKTNVDWSEENKDEAYKLNVEGLKVLFGAASKRDIPVAFFSTDYIFDGKCGPYLEEAKPNPLNIYGKHKLEGEMMLKAFTNKYIIIRTTWVFGCELQGKNFMYSVIKNLSSNKEMKVPEDMSSTPTYVKDLAKCTLDLIEKNIYDVFNLTSGQVISRFDFANNIAKVFDLNSSLLIPVKYSSMKLPANRPLVSGLKSDKITKLIDYKWTPLEDALKETRKEIKHDPETAPEIKNNSNKSTSSRICIFIPCYNAATTLPKVFERIPKEVKEKVEEVFVVDNDSDDYTYLMAIGYREKKSDIRNLKILKNVKNFGYGGSQKLAYAYAIKQGYDMVIMLHGDAQYAPEKLPVMIDKMEKDKSTDLLFGSRMKGDPLKGGMPFHRFLGNKALTIMQNFLLGTKISEFHSGYRIFRTSALKSVPFHLCSNDYHFDTEMIILFINNHLKIGEIPIDTFYGKEKNYVKIWEYGLNVLITTLCFWLYKRGLRHYDLYKEGVKADTDKIFKEFQTEVY